MGYRGGLQSTDVAAILRTQAVADLLAARGIGLQKQGQKWVLKAIGDTDHDIAA